MALFRHLMADIVVSSSFGYRLGAVGKWAMDVEEPLSTAINDFPKRGILVRDFFIVLSSCSQFSAAQRGADMGVELGLPYPQQPMAAAMRL